MGLHALVESGLPPCREALGHLELSPTRLVLVARGGTAIEFGLKLESGLLCARQWARIVQAKHLAKILLVEIGNGPLLRWGIVRGLRRS